MLRASSILTDIDQRDEAWDSGRMTERFTSVDEYIESQPAEQQAILREIRRVLLEAVPGGEEKYRYDMPAVMFDGRYGLHYAAWKKFVGLYPVARLDDGEHDALEEEIAPYRAAKDSINFPYSKPIPYDLIGRVAAALAARRVESA
ncbi:DUF1801 domain-containing protein [Agreia sp. PsM10]|uniref:iron chaperone n=1 Tax=Agreia sp. PsM10 TaxID=3030533 RepID=UPI00263B6445|nr:DUF1801 domain-containing protein [Agreia sp. PsM10]MDN4641660.1 DUF1801 domain-containing protein [Agreia sp. PsM10]